jgi:shikimate dehydrogenase
LKLLLGLIGHPVGHSLSPLLHRRGLAPLGIEVDYRLLDVLPSELASTLRRCFDDGFAGLNLTLPHKLGALEHAESVDPLAARIGATNTLVRGRTGWRAHNTDSEGLRRALIEFGVEPVGGALIVGGGGAARAALDALDQLGFGPIDLAVRQPKSIDFPGREVFALSRSSNRLATYRLVIHATPCGLPDHPAAPIDVAALHPDARLVDLVYRRRLRGTTLTLAAERRGLRACDGRAMLVHQAIAAQRLWLGRSASAPVMLGALDD